ncbi:MAG: hypothetical protein P8H57_12325 [Emcibacteraceae bacterium]|mgnify:FL=1|uniref:hypothetical protein n=1 Tax=Pseudemcibacter sp. TaxID=2943293 RepID=UPI003F69EF26|nr:hypothetical protein [Emcibacteraceae bacterium]MDG1727923.1 hypothetical protein [Emcibacteraceae bacterium]
MVRLFFIFSFIFLNLNTVTWPNDKVDQYNRSLNKGNSAEKFETIQRIIQEKVSSPKIEKSLFRLLRKSEDLESSLLYLEAYLITIDDKKKEMKAYDLFIDNGLDKRWPKGINKIEARSNFVAELEILNPRRKTY